MVKKIYKDLTEDQKRRKVYFSSTLTKGNRTEGEGDNIHEILEGAEEEQRRLTDDKFFNNSPYKLNIIRRKKW